MVRGFIFSFICTTPAVLPPITGSGTICCENLAYHTLNQRLFSKLAKTERSYSEGFLREPRQTFPGLCLVEGKLMLFKLYETFLSVIPLGFSHIGFIYHVKNSNTNARPCKYEICNVY